MAYITIDGEPYRVDTDSETAAAAEALREAGLESAPVYVGEPDGLGDSYKSGRVLFAAPTVDRCPVCKTPTHASESDDLGRCGPCAELVGEPHAEVQS